MIRETKKYHVAEVVFDFRLMLNPYYSLFLFQGKYCKSATVYAKNNNSLQSLS